MTIVAMDIVNINEESVNNAKSFTKQRHSILKSIESRQFDEK